ncbi:MAG TPA: hypothetical protein VFU71_17750 [Burkholderiaceae bacterium]|nr:hypothetical protein [Burkholderiaceae bacterium]
MELRQHLIQWERRRPDWVVGAVAGFAAGAVLMVLDLLWSTVVDPGGPWRTSHMIAPIFTGADAARAPNYDFSVGVVAIALAVHYVVGIVFGLILAAIMTPLHLDSTLEKAIGTGAVFGVVLYVVNFYGLVHLFPWLAELRGWPTIGAHLVFGVVAALLYAKLGRTAPVKSSTAG